MLEWLRRQGCSVFAPGFFKVAGIDEVSYKVVLWMAVHVQCQGELVHCSNGRLIYLADQGWCMPDEHMQEALEHAHACFCDFHGAAHWLAKQPFSHLILGSLDSELLQRIACEARIEFSEVFEDMPTKPKAEDPLSRATARHCSLPEDVAIVQDEDDTDSSSCGDEQMQDLTSDLGAVSLTQQAQLCQSCMKVSHLQEEGWAGSQWLSWCAMGTDCFDNHSVDDSERLPRS